MLKSAHTLFCSNLLNWLLIGFVAKTVSATNNSHYCFAISYICVNCIELTKVIFFNILASYFLIKIA